MQSNFCADSLYNPNYGYFPKEAFIFSPEEAFDFRSMKDESEFDLQLKQRYDLFDDELDKKDPNSRRQIWHTPTELFKPYYGEAIARYMATNYKMSLYPYYDLLIYEMGAGNGTLMLNVLDYIRAEHPEIYQRTKFKIIEISSALANVQAQNLKKAAQSKGHEGKVEIINQSIFDWDTYVSSPCFFLALEVFDNFAHDCIRYDPRTFEAQQSHVVIDEEGELFEHYDSHIDPVAMRFLQIRDMTSQSNGGIAIPQRSKSLRRFLPGYTGLSDAEYIPTRLMQFFDILHNYFPAHRLVSSDFNRLITEIPGTNAPVVQTRFDRQMVQVSTLLVCNYCLISTNYTNKNIRSNRGILISCFQPISKWLKQYIVQSLES
jgi:Putative S-adenosyl-L-methionine-dependent methyltransferase